MAQLVRKFNQGGIADPAPIKALGKHYNVDELRRELMGEKADAYAEAMGFNSKETAQFKQDLKSHVDELISGTMQVTDNNTLVNSSGNWENDGQFKKKGMFKWSLSDEEKKNNRSIHVTNYILGSLNAGNVKEYQPSGISYTLKFDDLFKERMHPNMAIEDYWETWDALDETTPDVKDKKGNVTKKGEKLTVNRLKHIADILTYEADRLDNDVRYRNESTWNGWQDKWAGRQLETSNRLREAASRLYDGKYTPEDVQFLIGIGVNMPMYLDPTKRPKKEAEQSAGTGTGTGTGTGDSGAGAVSGTYSGAGAGEGQIGFTTNFKPWEKQQYKFTYKGKTYVGSEINQLENIAELQDFFKDFKLNTAVEAAYARQGYKYSIDLTDALGQGATTRMYLTDKYDRRNALIVRHKPKENKWYTITNIRPFGSGYEILPEGSSKYIPPKNAATTTVRSVQDHEVGKKLQYKNDGQFAYDVKQMSAEALSSISYYRDALRKYIADVWKTDALAKKIQYDKKKLEWYQVPLGDGLAFRMYGGLSWKGDQLNLDDTKITDVNIVQYDPNTGKWVIVKKDGGKILKAQTGYTLEQIEPAQRMVIGTKDKSSTGGRTNAAIGYKEREKQKEYQEIRETDLARLGTSLVDLSSVVAAFVPGLHVASTATGMTASLGEFGADMVDWVNGRDGVSFWDSVGRLAVNLGMDAISLVPALKTVKGGSALRKVAKMVPHIAGAIQTYNLITDDELRASVGRTLTKIKDLDLDALDTQDFKNIAYVGRTLLAAKNIVKSPKSKGTDTGNVKVAGKVKVNGEYKTIEAEVPKEAIPKYKGKNEAAKKVLSERANELYGKTGETEVQFKPEDITLDSKSVRTTIYTDVPVAGPKKVFEGWLGSDGINWKYSDYNLAQTSPLVARLYGLPDPTTDSSKSSRTRKKTSTKEKDATTENVEEVVRTTDDVSVRPSQENQVKLLTEGSKRGTSEALTPTRVITDESRMLGPGSTESNLPVPYSKSRAQQIGAQIASGQGTGTPFIVYPNGIVQPVGYRAPARPNMITMTQSSNGVFEMQPTVITDRSRLLGPSRESTVKAENLKQVREVAKKYKSSRKDLKTMSDDEILAKYPTAKSVRKKASKNPTKKQRATRQKQVQDNLDALYTKYGTNEFSKLTNKQKKELGHRYGLSHTKQKSEIAQRYGKELLKHAMPTKLDKLSVQLLGKPLYPSYKLGGTLSYNLIKKLQDGGVPGVDYIVIDGVKYPIKGNEHYFTKGTDDKFSLGIYNKDNKQSGYDASTGMWRRFDGNKELTQIWDGSKFIDYNDISKHYYQQGVANDGDKDGTSIMKWDVIPTLPYYQYYGAKPTDVLTGSKGRNGAKGLSSQQLERDKDLYDEKGNLKADMSIQQGINAANDYFTSGNLTKDATNFIQANTGAMSMQQAIDLYNQRISTLNDVRKNAFTNGGYKYSETGGGDYNTLFNSVYSNYPGGFDANLADGQGTSWGKRFVYKATGDDPTAEGFDKNRKFTANGVELFVKSDGTLGLVNPESNTNFYYTDDQVNALIKGGQKVDYNKLTPQQQKLFKQEYGSTKKETRNRTKMTFNEVPLLSAASAGVTGIGNYQATQKKKELLAAEETMPKEDPGFVFSNYEDQAEVKQRKVEAQAQFGNNSANARDNIATQLKVMETYDPYITEARNNGTKQVRAQYKANYDAASTNADERRKTVDSNLAKKVALHNIRKDYDSSLISSYYNTAKGLLDEMRVAGQSTDTSIRKIKYEKNVKDRYDLFQKDYANELIDTYGQDAVKWYKTKYNLTSDVAPTKSIIEEYARYNPIVANEAEDIFKKHKLQYDQDISGYSEEYVNLPIYPFEFNRYKQKYDYGLGKYVTVGKKGAKLSASDKKKIEKIKQYNKAMETTYKEHMKNIREDMRLYRAQQRTNSAGTLHLLKQLSK